jgi:hypothetical protein
MPPTPPERAWKVMQPDWSTVNPRTPCAFSLYQRSLRRALIALKIQRLQEESDSIRWQVVSRQATLTFSDSAAQRLLDIQGQIGQVRRSIQLLFLPVRPYVRQAIGALSALGAGLALSLLFSATRGLIACFEILITR